MEIECTPAGVYTTCRATLEGKNSQYLQRNICASEDARAVAHFIRLLLFFHALQL